jgi:hypothetical protein
MMNRFRVTIRSAMALVLFAGVGLAALRCAILRCGGSAVWSPA